MILEDRLDFGVETYFTHRIAKQIADHPHFSGIGQLDHDHQIRTRRLERRMRWMPDPLPTVNLPAA